MADELYPEALVAGVQRACERLATALQVLPSSLSRRAAAWLASFTRDQGLSAAMLAPESFPLALPAWAAEESLTGAVTDGLQAPLLDSVLAMYLYIRLNDDVMDADGAGYPALLPLGGWLHHRFTAPLHALFDAGHPFWSDFDAVWALSAAVTVEDALASSIDETAFEQVSGLKCVAAALPALAVAHALGAGAAAPVWTAWAKELSRWHQHAHDLKDWKKDLEHGAVTVITSAAAPDPSETASAWFYRVGLDAAQARQQERTRALMVLSGHLGSPTLDTYLRRRQVLEDSHFAAVRDGLRTARALFGLS